MSAFTSVNIIVIIIIISSSSSSGSRCSSSSSVTINTWIGAFCTWHTEEAKHESKTCRRSSKTEHLQVVRVYVEINLCSCEVCSNRNTCYAS